MHLAGNFDKKNHKIAWQHVKDDVNILRSYVQYFLRNLTAKKNLKSDNRVVREILYLGRHLE